MKNNDTQQFFLFKSMVYIFYLINIVKHCTLKIKIILKIILSV